VPVKVQARIDPAPAVRANPLARVAGSPWPRWLLAQAVTLVPALVAVATALGAGGAARFLVSAVVALAVQNAFTWALRRRVGPERSTAADLLTHGRGAVAAALAGFVALALSGPHAQPILGSWLALGYALFGATLLDWLDGPLARRAGPTRLGGALDIEVDSWLTLWCAVAAVTLGGLPWWCLLPPLAHYLQPVHALRHGRLPAGGGPLWGRLSGVAQMALLLAALLPVGPAWRVPALSLASVPIGAVQVVAMLSGYRRIRLSAPGLS
jgi:phosphatidylglycerophosphate synthase